MHFSRTLKDQLNLHFIVFIWGFTGVLGKMLQPLNATSIVFYRTIICIIVVTFLLFLQKKATHLNNKTRLNLLFIGCLIGIHWVFFFLGIHVSNVSTALIGIATGSLWTSILEPIMLKTKVKIYEIVLGIFIIFGIWVIVEAEGINPFGLYYGIIAAQLTALFSILNVKSVGKVKNVILITQYEMIGALLTIIVLSPLLDYTFDIPLQFELTQTQIIALVVLSALCTVYPYVASIELLKRVSAYSVNLATNLEPIYAILLAFIFFNENETLNSRFYIGSTIIMIAVLSDPILKQVEKRRINKRKSVQGF